EAAEREEGESAARQRRRALVRGQRLTRFAVQLVRAPDTFPEIARLGINVARLCERGEGGVEVAASHVELAPAGEDVLATDRRGIAAAVEGTAGVQRLRGSLEVAQVAMPTREVEEDLHLDPPPALALLARGIVPDGAGARERLDRLPGPVQLLQAVAAPEETEMIGREGGEGTVVPAQRLG